MYMKTERVLSLNQLEEQNVASDEQIYTPNTKLQNYTSSWLSMSIAESKSPLFTL